jgi:hypothetical protein
MTYEGRCPKCGSRYYGWALANPRHQMCNKCGTALEILMDGKVIKSYSPFTDDEYKIKNKDDVSLKNEIHEGDLTDSS